MGRVPKAGRRESLRVRHTVALERAEGRKGAAARAHLIPSVLESQKSSKRARRRGGVAPSCQPRKARSDETESYFTPKAADKPDAWDTAKEKARAREERDRRERRRKRRKAEIFITRHVEQIIQRQEFILKFARAMMMFGGPSHRLQAQVQTGE